MISRCPGGPRQPWLECNGLKKQPLLIILVLVTGQGHLESFFLFFSYFWVILARFWVVRGHFGSFCLALGHYGWFWLVFGHFG